MSWQAKSPQKPKPVLMVESAQRRVGNAVLVVYNVLQLLLWGRVAFLLCSLIATSSSIRGTALDKLAFLVRNVYYECGESVILVQRVSCLEIAFVLAGFLKTPILSIVMQLLARNIVILFTIQYADSPVVHESPAILICFIAWTLADLPRFAWLLVKTATSKGALLSVLTAVRYSSFVVLYPLGGVGEFWSMYNAVGLGVKRDLLDVGLNLPQSFIVDVDSVVKYLYFPLFLPGFLFLYLNMLRSRRRRNKASAQAQATTDSVKGRGEDKKNE